MGTRDTYRNTLIYALAIAGSEIKLAALMKVTVPQIENWLNGIDDVPDRAFLNAVDVVVHSSRAARSRSRDLLVKFSKSISRE